jgi:hypothetical protein
MSQPSLHNKPFVFSHETREIGNYGDGFLIYFLLFGGGGGGNFRFSYRCEKSV